MTGWGCAGWFAGDGRLDGTHLCSRGGNVRPGQGEHPTGVDLVGVGDTVPVGIVEFGPALGIPEVPFRQVPEGIS